jgi:hypothetical protein
VCSGNRETTVLAHLKNGWYGSLKPPDIVAVHACSDCHDAIDGRSHPEHLTREEIDLAAYRGLCEMLCYYVREGIVSW